MSWVCKICSSNNDDSAEFCFVCDSPKAVAPPPPVPAPETSLHSRGARTYSLTKKRAADLRLSGDIVVPAEFTAIADGAFYNRTDVRSVTLHGGITKIGRQAFKGCRNLKKVVCPMRLTSIASEAFKDCPIPVSERPKASYVASDAFSAPTSGMYEGWDRVAPISEMFGRSAGSSSTSGSAATTSSRTASTPPRRTTTAASTPARTTTAAGSSRPSYSYTPSRRSYGTRRRFDGKTKAKIIFWSFAAVSIIAAAAIWLVAIL